ncbi:MAG: hypothetical protein KKA42_00560 [candidate division Zixibacteria bacterium]|nr:hypothetical protein [candidate division Zixibacteria bacterium]
MKKTLTPVAILLLVAALLGAGCDVADKRVEIRFKFKPGMNLHYTELSRGSYKVFYGDSLAQDMSNEITKDLLWAVDSLRDDSAARITESMTYRVQSVSNLDTAITDSTRERKELILYIMPNGKITDVDFGSEPATRYVKSYLDQGLPVFPAGAHGQGYQWTQTTAVQLAEGPVEATTTFEIKSFAREQGYDCVIIGYRANMVLPIEASREEMPPKEQVNRTYEFLGGRDNITSTGHIYFAYTEGHVVRQKERWILDGNRNYLVLKTGDTSATRIAVEYDVDYQLQRVAQN